MNKKVMLILVSSDGTDQSVSRTAATGNNNKFYYVELDGTTINLKYGRVGTEGQSKTKQGQSERDFDKIIAGKIKRGYSKADIDLDADSSEVSVDRDVMAIALAQIQSDEDSKDLIKKLVKKNIHNITSNTKIKFNMDTGLFTTPLGSVSKAGVNKAKVILDKLALNIDDNGILKGKREATVRKLSEEYYQIIPTIISDLRNINSHIINNRKLIEQNDICDALLQTIDMIDSEKDKSVQSVKDDKDMEQLFDTSLTLLKDISEFDRIVKYFEDSKNKQHGYRTSTSKIKRIFNMSIAKDDNAYRHDMDNQMELWHGTKLANLLSILKSGLLMPKQSPGSVTGYMFGQFLYFSDISSKSLNYCDGMYWNSSSRDDNLVYMFVADIAMGNYQVPRGPTSKHPDKGYDSYWAKPGQSGIMNNEMIVPKNEQIKLKYLLEIQLS